MKELGEELKANGLPAAERQKIVLAEQKKWEDQRTAGCSAKSGARSQECRQVQRGRPARCSRGWPTRRFTHIWKPTSIRDSAYDVPRWLNEGLAQTFEAGLLEADTLRIDTPEPRGAGCVAERLARRRSRWNWPKC